MRLITIFLSLTVSYSFQLHMKTIVVFGGTGKTGSEVVYQSLKSGYKAVVLARDPSKMKIPKGSGGANGDNPFVNPNLTVLQGKRMLVTYLYNIYLTRFKR